MISSRQWNRELLAAITSAQEQMIGEVQPKALFGQLLDSLLSLAASEYGFIAEVVKPAEAAPFLRTRALTDISWDETSQRFYEGHAPVGLEFTNLDSLFGAVVTGEEHVIANAPTSDPRRTGLPEGHPPLDSFLGLALHSGGSLVGVAGVANRIGGYDEALTHNLKPFVQTCANALLVVREASERKLAEAELREERLRLQVMLEGVFDGVVTLNSNWNIESANSAAEKIFGYSQAQLRGQPGVTLFAEERRERYHESTGDYKNVGHIEYGTTFETLGRRKNGETFPMQVTASEVQVAGELFIAGVFRDLSERYETEALLKGLRSALEQEHFGQMVGRSAPMRRLYAKIQDVSAGDWTVLIEGETGVGKELVARALHAASPRGDAPFVATNLAGVNDSLIASQLFGHQRGAFTGAVCDQQGLFEAAEGGTLFLDEIGDASESVQIALLRALEEREIVRIGENQARSFDVRVIAATNHSLAERVDAGQFRKDLLYRLRVARLRVPPLRDRGNDIALLAEAFLAEARASTGKPIVRFAQLALRRMMTYEWPGNVRELRNAVDYASIHCKGPSIQLTDLPAEFQVGARSTDLMPTDTSTPDQERERISEALKQVGGNRSHAARLLGISRATLYRRLDTLGIGA